MHGQRTTDGPRITGSIRVEDRKAGRVWVAKFMQATGSQTRQVLGPAWVKDTGRRTARDAPVWRAADGPKPTGHLTPQDARDALADILAAEKAKPRTTTATAGGRTFGDLCRAYLVYAQREQAVPVTAATLANYRRIIDTGLLPAYGEHTPPRRLTTERIEARRENVLAGRVKGVRGKPMSRDALRREMVLMGAVMRLARKRGWISHNPMDGVEAVHPPARSEDFNVLTTEQVEAVARKAASGWEPVEPGERKGTRVSEDMAAHLTEIRRDTAQTHAAMIRFAAYTGLRLGELRALRWRDIDWQGAIVHVRRNAPTSAPAGEKEKAPKSGRARTVPLSDEAARTAEGLSRRDRWTEPGDRVFPSPTGEAIDDVKVRRAFYDALTTAGLGSLRTKEEPMTWHDLRHSFGTTCAVAGIPEVTIQSWMGHAHGETTKRYMHHAPRHDDARRLSLAQSHQPGENDSARPDQLRSIKVPSQ